MEYNNPLKKREWDKLQRWSYTSSRSAALRAKRVFGASEADPDDRENKNNNNKKNKIDIFIEVPKNKTEMKIPNFEGPCEQISHEFERVSYFIASGDPGVNVEAVVALASEFVRMFLQ